MMRKSIFFSMAIGFSVLPYANAANVYDGNLRVGAAAVELLHPDTRTFDRYFNGAFGRTELKGRDGPLRAVATVIQGPPDETRIAIVALDIAVVGRDTLDVAARDIESKTGIPFDHILINCTHTHHSLSTARVHGGDAIPEDLEQVRQAVVQSVVQANENLLNSTPVTLLFKMGRESTVGENSRLELRDQTIYWAGSFEDEIGPTGPFDPDFPVMIFRRPDRSPAAVLFGHSTHTIGTRHPGRWSPGFYGLAAQTFEKESGAVTSFLEGASGSTHMLRLDGRIFAQAPEQVSVDAERRILNALRYTADQAEPMLVNRIASIRREMTVTVRRFDEQEEEQAVSDYTHRRFVDHAWKDNTADRITATFRQMRAELAPHRGEQRRTWITVMRIGDVAIVGVPCELFAQLGVDIKKRSPFRYTLIAELANDWVGYVGNADAYRLGGYQLWTGLHSWTERGTGESIVDEAVRALNELHLQ